jgi:hypothetical protein
MHGHPPGAEHIFNMSVEGLKDAAFTHEDAEMITYTRIRLGRNIAGFPLGPGLNKPQRL